MLKKIITYFLILAVIAPIFASVVPFGVTARVAYAESGKGEIETPCGWTLGIAKGTVGSCIAFSLVWLFYEFGMHISVWITGFVSDLFNASIQFSLTGTSFDAEKNIMIKDGWTMVRDLFNLVFIFILLYAAIATILQYGNMDIKKILPGLIVAALLVNFSLMISKVVIDASHVFAWEFYNQIDSTKGGLFKPIKGSAEVVGNFEKKDLAGVFLAGFNPQRLLLGTPLSSTTTSGVETRSTWSGLMEYAGKGSEGFLGQLWKIVIIIGSTISLALFASFILLAGAIMFIIRVVILWILMIFSPLAFLGMILPSMKSYSTMWWKNLIDQSFFAPAFLFMFMLATKFVNANLMDSILKTTPNDNSMVVVGLNMGNTLVVFFNFIVIATLLSACLIVAKKMGGKSAEYGMKWAHKGKDLALGGANKMLWKPSRLGLRYGGGLAGDSNWWNKSFGRVPGGGILGRKLGAMKKADEDKTRKAGEKYAGTLSGAGRASLNEEKNKREWFGSRFVYGAGVFEKTREGYGNVIAKKKEADKEKELYHESWAYLLGDLKHGETYSDEEKKYKRKNIKERIEKGELGKMEEEADIKQKERQEAKEKAKEENELKIKENEREIRMLEAQQAELYKDGKHSAEKEYRINDLDKSISALSKLNAGMIVVEKALERHEKRTESYRVRQESKSKPVEEKKLESKKIK